MTSQVGIGMIILFLILPYFGTISVAGFAKKNDSEVMRWAPLLAIALYHLLFRKHLAWRRSI